MTFSFAKALAFAALATLALAFSFESVFGLEEDPAQVLARVLYGIRLLQGVRGQVVHNHVDFTGAGVKVEQVLEAGRVLGDVVVVALAAEVGLVLVLVPVLVVIPGSFPVCS